MYSLTPEDGLLDLGTKDNEKNFTKGLSGSKASLWVYKVKGTSILSIKDLKN